MKLLRWSGSGPHGGERHVAALFGLGLIGGAIETALHTLAALETAELAFSWNRADSDGSDVSAIFARLCALATPDAACTLHVVWAAGAAGFGAGEAELAREGAAFEAVLRLSGDLAEALPRARRHFHLVSSAGGLFEGVRYVDAQTVPAPRRAYGRAKLEQERALARLSDAFATHIYRPGSVYGLGKPGSRAGLVTTLLRDAIANRTSRLFVRPDTLRDFVLADDVGRFIAARMVDAALDDGPFLLASGRPTAMTEAVALVERTLGRRLQLQFEPGGDNGDDNTYRASALPAGFAPTALETGIRLTAMRVAQGFYAPA